MGLVPLYARLFTSGIYSESTSLFPSRFIVVPVGTTIVIDELNCTLFVGEEALPSIMISFTSYQQYIVS